MKRIICAVAIAGAVATTAARAQNFSAHFEGVSPGLSINGTFDNSYYDDLPSGVLAFTGFDAFCVQPTTPIAYGDTVVYQVQDPQTLASHGAIARLVGGFLASSKTEEHAAAVQWAIWEIILDGLDTPSFSTGNSRITLAGNSATIALAEEYLLNVDQFSPVVLTYLTSPTHQDVVTWQHVPEPATAGLAALSGLLLLRRRR